jgi:hypothetical protein
MMRILWHGPPLVGPPPPQPHNRPKTMTTTTTTTTSVGDRQRVSSRTRSAFKALSNLHFFPPKLDKRVLNVLLIIIIIISSSSSRKVCWFLKFSLLQRASRMRKCSWLCIPPRLLVLLLLLLLLLELHHLRCERASEQDTTKYANAHSIRSELNTKFVCKFVWKLWSLRPSFFNYIFCFKRRINSTVFIASQQITLLVKSLWLANQKERASNSQIIFIALLFACWVN